MYGVEGGKNKRGEKVKAGLKVGEKREIRAQQVILPASSAAGLKILETNAG